MHDDLSNATWGHVQEALGGCDLAELVRDLCDEDEERYGRAWTTLHMAVIGYDCDGPFVEGTAELVIPFIIALLRVESILGKQGLLSILAETDCDRFVEYKHLAERHASMRFSAQGLEDGEDPIRVAVRAGLDTYLVLLGAPDPLVRSGAATLLSIIPEAADHAGPLLISMMRTDPAPEARAAAADALGRVFGRDVTIQEMLTARMRDEADELVRLVCAQVLAEGAEGQAPEEAASLLASALDDPEGALSRYVDDLPYGQRDALSYISHAVSRLAPPRAALAIPSLIASLGRVESYWQGECVLQALLHAAFGEETTAEGKTDRAFGDERRYVLTAIAASEPLWAHVDAQHIGRELDSYRLPRTRAGLRDVLSAPPAV